MRASAAGESPAGSSGPASSDLPLPAVAPPGLKGLVVADIVDQLAVEPDATKRADISTQVDKLVMENAALYPGIYAKGVLLRGKNTTNVFINDALSGQYDYTAMGVKK